MHNAPLILISPSTARKGVEFFDYSVSLSDAYGRAICGAGGVPWILSATVPDDVLAESVRRCDGVMLTGGDDIQPALYGTKISARVRKTLSIADPERDHLELKLVREVFRQRKPLLAICRGHQILNVAFGGTLVADIPLQVPGALNHTRMDRKDSVVHQIAIARGSVMANIFGKEKLGVNSTHHQAVDRVAKPFQVTATSPDGIVEAIELAPSEQLLLPFLLSVQFHPERLVRRNPQFVQLFRSFIEASRKGAQVV